jgi:hypothetical protein
MVEEVCVCVCVRGECVYETVCAFREAESQQKCMSNTTTTRDLNIHNLPKTPMYKNKYQQHF